MIERSVAGGAFEPVAELPADSAEYVADFEVCAGSYVFRVTAVEEPRDSVPAVSAPVDVCDMVLVPQGAAWVGCNPDGPDPFDEACKPDELPFHEVRLSAFWLDRVEVSQEEYRACVDAASCAAPAILDDPELTADDQPVVGVNWMMAADFCAWKGKRLPTEAEWEKAARGPGGAVYPWGDAWDPSFANWDDNGQYDGYAAPAPVLAFQSTPSPYGALNLAGNVWEWVSDFYDPDYFSGKSGARSDRAGNRRHAPSQRRRVEVRFLRNQAPRDAPKPPTGGGRKQPRRLPVRPKVTPSRRTR
ncbi:MAG: formylglycine-generating enzyme family protein [Deltaproteobacteria bacterium]|nr:formylglycine-generating enzyme family protein [Deltaproteobacteria bacterium]